MTEDKKYVLHVHGMHCPSCVFLTQDELEEYPKITAAKSNLETRTVEFSGDFGDMPLTAIATELTGILGKHGYALSTEPEKKKINWKEFIIAVPIALGFIFLFLLLQKLKIVNLVHANDVTYSAAFVIGIIASLSTCMAVVGGLVLSMSATFAKAGDKVRPQILFHLGRIVSFCILGGIIGAVGSVFQLGTTGIFILGLLVGIVMLVLGINLLDIFDITKRLQPAMPKFLTKKALQVKKINHVLTPALVGIATFFLPCGFTQSMQIYTLTTGSFVRGALTMFFFALGTLPVLALISFSSFSITESAKAGIFFKSAGIVVILFALFNVYSSFAAAGFINPLFNF